jgi:hypothetical protein
LGVRIDAIKNAIMAEWTRNDGINEDYASRVVNLEDGANEAPILNATTVHSSGGNSLLGGAGLGLFFANIDLDSMDREPATGLLVGV